MKQTFLAVSCILLAVLYFNSLEAMAAATTVRPYKFGFTIEEQQHRSEKRDENGIVMGEFGFITADGKYHVTVYATDENGKFKIISMKSFPYAGPVAPSTPTAIATTTRAPLPKHQFSSPACSGCFLSKSPAVAAPVQGTVAAAAPRPHKTEIRPLSLPLPPAPVVAPAGVTAPATGAANPASNNGLAQTPTGAQSLPAYGNFGKPSLSNSPNSAAAATKPGSGQASLSNSPNSAPTATKPGQASLYNSPALAATATKTGTGQPSLNSATLATTSTNQLAGDLYKFKYLLDYNGHEETGSRNGDKEGNYFAIGEDEVSRTIEYIANEFGFQPHISWRKLDQSEVASLPKENSLKHYEFKWFNKASE